LENLENDKAIRAALQAGDPRAVEMIWDTFAADLLAVLQALLCHQQNAEDCLQRLFVKLVRNPAGLLRARRLQAYLIRMARNEAYDWLKQHRHLPAHSLPDENWLVARQTDADRADLIACALRVLPTEQRLIVALKVFRGKTFAELGDLLKLSPNTVASRYRYGLQKLKAYLEEAQNESRQRG
jgi:RNA polymerase sigma-70 factor (ECF subfamily)